MTGTPSPHVGGGIGLRASVVVLLLLALLTFLGTLAAADEGVLAARARYFDSFLVWQPVGPWFAVPLPGARLLLLAMFILLVIDKAAWRPQPGRCALPFVHAGVALLLATALWSASAREATAHVAPGGSVQEVAAGAEPWRLPFALHVRAVHREYHPRTDQQARFEVEVDVEPPGEPSYPARITLHAPLHHGGVSVHLRGDPAGMLQRTAPVELVLTRDPADLPRLLACLLVAAGLLAHFAAGLWRHLRTGG